MFKTPSSSVDEIAHSWLYYDDELDNGHRTYICEKPNVLQVDVYCAARVFCNKLKE